MLPDWLHRIVIREYAERGLYASAQIHRVAVESARDLDRLAAETARTNDPAAAAANLFGGPA
jgi:hypothetical protein